MDSSTLLYYKAIFYLNSQGNWHNMHYWLEINSIAMGVTRKDKIKNEYIRGTVEVEWLEMKMREGRLRWYGNVMRRDQEYMGRKMMEMELLGKRRRGRPRRRFLDVVKEDMGEVDVKEQMLKIVGVVIK